MQIQINTDDHIDGTEALAAQVSAAADRGVGVWARVR
jgi:hypothetical protein